NGDVDAGLTDVTSGLVLVTVVHDPLDPVTVPGLQQPRGYQVRDVPPDLRDVVEVLDTRRYRVGAGSEGEAVRGRVTVPGQRRDDRVLRLVDRLHHALPRPAHRVRRDRVVDAQPLPVPASCRVVRVARLAEACISRDVRDVDRRVDRPPARIHT